MLLANQMFAQFSEDFSDSELNNNPTWIGDLNAFITNQDDELQLNATDAGQSAIFTQISYGGDISWEIDFMLDFSPSGSNQLTLYLLSSTPDADNEESLWIEIGETGSDDAIKLYYQNGSVPIATGISGRFSDSPDAVITAALSNTGVLTVMSKLASENSFLTEFSIELFDITLRDYYFGIQCNYTSTRKDKFFFRSINVDGSTQEDLTPPRLIQSVVNNSQICLQFNESLDQALSLEELVIQVDNELQENIEFDGNQIKINTSGSIPEGSFDVSITGLSDFSGNRLDTLFSAFLPVLPKAGDLVINELLFDPVTDGDDFLEILNNSDKAFDLDGLVISNTQSGKSVTINQSIILQPAQIIAFSPNVNQLIEFYHSADPERIFRQSLPAFGNNGGSVSLEMNNEILDLFFFSDDLHHPLLDDPEGVSLEKVDPNLAADESNSWASASENVGFATPGSSNSTLRTGKTSNDLVVLNSDSFSPNGDGDNDELEILLTPQANSVGSIVIYDQTGNSILKLKTNILLGSQDRIIWDGRLENGNRAPIGIYIIRVEVFDITGQVFDVKKAVALVDFIN